MLFKLLFMILAVPGLFLAVYGLYFLCIALFGIWRRAHYDPAAPAARFAVLIAARNESAVIGNLVDSLLAQRYPRALYEVIVAPNNCTDDTEAVARAHGARIFCPQGKITGKGEVLRQAVDQIALQEKFDAICVFDADNLVDPDFLARMNDAFCSGSPDCWIVTPGMRPCRRVPRSAARLRAASSTLTVETAIERSSLRCEP